MDAPVNLYTIYHKVYQRQRRSRGQKLKLAEKATELAKIVLEKKTLKSIKELRLAEDQWISLSTTGARSMADEFESAIRSGNYCVKYPELSSSHFGWDPRHGVIYAFQCSEGGGLIKIGASQGSIAQAKSRINSYATRYNLSGVKMIILLEVSKPASIEKSLHDLFAPHRTSIYWSKSNEWFNIGQVELKNAIKNLMTVDSGAKIHRS